MSHFRRIPRPVTMALEEIRADLAPETVLAEAQTAWRGAVGEAIAEHAEPVCERAGVLTIACSASVWAHELELMSDSIIERLNGALGASVERDKITRIRCVTTPISTR